MKINLKFNGQREANHSAEYSSAAKKWDLDLQVELSPEEFIQGGKIMLESFKLGIENVDHIIDHIESSKMRLIEHDHHLKLMREERRERRHNSKEDYKE